MTPHLSMTEVVGRGPAIAGVVEWFERARSIMLVLEGPPGLGKTTVWRAAVGAIRQGGAHVLSAAPTEPESGFSYSGLADLLASDFADIAPMLPPPQKAALAFALRLERAHGRAADETAVARGALGALRLIAQRHGRILVAVDDLQWLDAPSAAIIDYVRRRLDPAESIRILATRRSAGAGHGDPVRAEDVERVALEPISVGGIHRVVRLRTGVSLPRPRLLEVHAMTSGNPLHAIELVRAIGIERPAQGSSLVDLFAGRIGSLPPSTIQALGIVAASVDRTLVRLGAAWAAGHGGRDSFARAIGPASDAGLVTFVGDAVQPMHPLVGHVANQLADAASRHAAHRALAASARDPEERVHHLGRSVDAPDAGIADEIEAVARSDRSRGIRALRAGLFERAAVLTPPMDRDDAGRRWLAAGAAWFEAGDPSSVERLLRPMIEAWPGGDQRAEAKWRLGTALDESGRWRDAKALWQSALRDVNDPVLRSQVLCSRAITAMYTESMATAVLMSARAVDAAEGSGSVAGLARALAVRSFLLTMAGRDGSGPLMERALAIEEATDADLGEWSPTALAAERARHLGDVRAAEAGYEAVLERAIGHGDANLEQWAAYGLGMASILVGRIGRADELADLVLDLSEQTGLMRIPARVLRAHADAHLGLEARARLMLDEAMTMARTEDEAAHLYSATLILGTVEACAGRDAAAADAYLEARIEAERLGLAHATALLGFLLEAEAAARAGRLDQAGFAMASFDRLAGTGPPAWVRPIRSRAVAAMLAASDQLDAARLELEAIVQEGAALPPDLAHAELALAGVLRRQRRLRAAREAAERARSRFVELGMVTSIAAAEREAARTPGRRPGVPDELSPAEARVAELVATGLTNRDVAAELVLSVKTVEVTLTRVYGKLGIRSRAELAVLYRGRSLQPIV